MRKLTLPDVARRTVPISAWLASVALLLADVWAWQRGGGTLTLAGVAGTALALAATGYLARALDRAHTIAYDRGHQLEVRNQQLHILLQATRTMSGVLDQASTMDALLDQVTGYTRFKQAVLALGPSASGEYQVGPSRGLPEAFLRELPPLLRNPLRGYFPVEWARLTRQPALVDDVGHDSRLGEVRPVLLAFGLSAVVAVPLVVQEQVTGVLAAFLDRPAQFSTAEVSLLSAIAGQGALALETTHLYNLTEANRRRLDRAVDFMQNISSGLARTRVGVVDMLRLTAQATARLFEPSSVFIMVKRDEGRPLMVHDHAGVDPDLVMRHRSMVQDGVPVTDHRTLSVPITVDGEQMGRFEVFLEGQGRVVPSEELNILHAFVHLTASAMGNAGLVAELRQAVEQVERAYMGTLEALTKALEMRDHETQGHSRRVVEYTLALAQRLAVGEDLLVPMIRGALLHDIGKIGIPDSILRKPGPLSEEEWAVMRTHPYIGFHMLKQIDFLATATPIILHHHEKFNGSGYPLGLSANDIPIGARIFAVADAYDAITSDRPYKTARSHRWALEEIGRGAGQHFDPAVVQALLGLPEEEMVRIRNRDLELHGCARS